MADSVFTQMGSVVKTAIDAKETTLQANIDAEETARIAADTTLQTNIDGKLDSTAQAIDSDKLDNLESTQFLRSDADDTYANGVLRVDCDPDATMTYTQEQNGLQVYQATAGADAMMSFHVKGDYGMYFGMDGGTNKLSVGGWFSGENSYAIYHEGNKPTPQELGAAPTVRGNFSIAKDSYYRVLRGSGFLNSSAMRLSFKGTVTNVTGPVDLDALAGGGINKLNITHDADVTSTLKASGLETGNVFEIQNSSGTPIIYIDNAAVSDSFSRMRFNGSGVAIGYNASANADDGMSFGRSCSANANAIAVGHEAFASPNASAYGFKARAEAYAAVSLGYEVEAKHYYSTMIGHGDENVCTTRSPGEMSTVGRAGASDKLSYKRTLNGSVRTTNDNQTDMKLGSGSDKITLAEMSTIKITLHANDGTDFLSTELKTLFTTTNFISTQRGTLQVNDTVRTGGATNWDCLLIIDVIDNDQLLIKVTGENSKTIQWSAIIEIYETPYTAAT